MAPRGFAEKRQAGYDAAPAPRSVPYTNLKMDSAGRIIVPTEMRSAMLAKPGDVLTAQVVDGELRIVSRDWIMHRVKEHATRFKAANPGVSVVDELIADRREEARKEIEEANAWRRQHGLAPFDTE